MKVLSPLLLAPGLISFILLVSNIITIPLQIDGILVYAQNNNKTVAREAEIPGALFAHNPGNPLVNDSKQKVQ